MKYKTIIYLIVLIAFSTTSLGYTVHLDDIGWGADRYSLAVDYTWIYYDSPTRFQLKNNDYIFFQSKDIGYSELSFDMQCVNYTSVPCNWFCDYLNRTGNTNTWTNFINYNMTSFTETVTGNFDSNTGVFRCLWGLTSPSINANISGTSTLTNAGTTYRTFNSGQKSSIWFLNENLWAGTLNDIESNIYATDYGASEGIEWSNWSTGLQSGIAYAEFRPSFHNCSNSGVKIYGYDVYNADTGVLKTYYLNLNLNASPPLEITSFTYGNGSIQVFPNTVTLNLTVTTNQSSLVDAIVWYKTHNGQSGVIPNIGYSNYSVRITLEESPYPYLIEVQLEDNDCGYYPTRSFYVYVGQYINLSGQVYYRDGAVIDVLTDIVDIQINNSVDTYYTTTNVNGSYNFPFLPAGIYSLIATKDFFGYDYHPKETFTAIGESYLTPYTHDFIVNYTGTSSFVPTLNCQSNISTADITCCLSNPYSVGYYVTAYPNGFGSGFESWTFYRNTSGCWSFNSISANYTQCDTTYDITVNGFSEYPQANQNVRTVDCAVVTTTTTTTTSPVTTTTQVPWDLFCNASNSEVEIECWYNTTEKYPLLWVYKGIGYDERELLGSFYLGGIGGYYNGSLNLTDWFDGVYRPSLYCGSWYWIYLDGFEEELGQWAGTVACNSTFSTTTTPPTTLPIPIDIDGGYVPFQPNGSANVISFNCTNLTGKIMNGDVYHAALCPFILILGVSLFYGFALLLIILLTYKVTESFGACSIIGLLYTGVFINVMPQPTLNYLSVGVAFTLGLGLYSIFRR